MSNLWYELAGYKLGSLYERISRVEEPIAETLPMAPGNNRVYIGAVPRRLRLTIGDTQIDEATWATWRAAARAAQVAGVTLVEPGGETWTVRCVRFTDPITWTSVQANEDTLDATGEAYRDVTIELESL